MWLSQRLHLRCLSLSFQIRPLQCLWWTPGGASHVLQALFLTLQFSFLLFLNFRNLSFQIFLSVLLLDPSSELSVLAILLRSTFYFSSFFFFQVFCLLVFCLLFELDFPRPSLGFLSVFNPALFLRQFLWISFFFDHTIFLCFFVGTVSFIIQ